MGVITGAGKADVLASLTAGTGSHYPVAKVRQADGSLPRLLLDKAAASKIHA
jgi:6-phosphogluconolactonase/glucosamine-6-phosphate isomerase/deaminase